jgi:NTE family protein
LLEVQHRARDIMFSDKTLHNIQISKTITYYLRFIDELYHMIESELDSEKREKNREKLEKIRIKYKRISEQHGAEIKGVYYISRDEQFPSLRENADFSIDTVKASIKQAELKTNHILKNITLS